MEPIKGYTKMTVKELTTKLNAQLEANEVLRNETTMFDAYYRHTEQRDRESIFMKTSVGGTDRRGSETDSQAQADVVGGRTGRKSDHGPGVGTVGVSSRRRSRSSSQSERMYRLSSEQKCTVAEWTITQYADKLRRLQQDEERDVDNCKAIVEANDGTVTDMRREQYEFERDVIRVKVTGDVKVITTERVVRFFEEKIKSKERKIEKMRLQNSTLKSQLAKTEKLLKQKEEVGDFLLAVDFDQLKIENKQCLAKMEEQKHELLESKTVADAAQRELNIYKHRLNQVVDEAKRLRDDIESRRIFIQKIDCELTSVEKEMYKAKAANEKLRRDISNYNVPDALYYIEVRTQVMVLRKEHKMWKQKVDIARKSLQDKTAIWERTQRTAVKCRQLMGDATDAGHSRQLFQQPSSLSNFRNGFVDNISNA